jgi:hypothetical protein
MIVDDLDVGRSVRRPTKTYPPLVVDSNRALTLAILRECFKSIPGRRPQVIQSFGGFQRF